ncbi:MAG: TIGR00730 family Rossman fold protein [Alphaproteobacteria bacterium]|nr:TIGR00730 family Rossman fold protein [Alphaproteobacteria bacterium]
MKFQTDTLNGNQTVAPTDVNNVCVYCGSGAGIDPQYAEAAKTLGCSLSAAGLGLVYGGGSLGLMGETARATLGSGGRVTGIIPSFLSEKEKMLKAVDELIVVDDMHQRKMLMFQRSDAFVALPGGIGTLEELVEQLTWTQLGQHGKPVIVANIANFWSPFLALLDHMREQKFIREGLDVNFEVVETAEEIVPAILRIAHERSQLVPDKAVTEKF